MVEERRPSPEPATETVSPSGDRPSPIPTNQVESRPPTPSELVRLTELDGPLQLITSPPPNPTSEAQDAGVGGRVILSVLVGEDGSVTEARVIVEPGYGLGPAAVEAVRGWRYTPPLRAGLPVRVWKTEEINFRAPGESGAGTP